MLLHTNPVNIVEAIKNKIDELFTAEEDYQKPLVKFFKDKDAGPPKDYEQMLQSLEEEIRNHVSVEQQLKLEAEAAQAECDEAVSENQKLKEKIAVLL